MPVGQVQVGIAELVDANGELLGLLALDSSGNPHVAYTDGGKP